LIFEIKNPSTKIWDNVLEKAGPNGTIFQSTVWADYLKKTYGDRPIYLAYFDKRGNILGLLLALESCYAKHPALTQLGKSGMVFGKIYRHVAARLLHKVLPFIYWEGGPVVLPTSQNCSISFDRKIVYRKIIDRITEIATSRNCYEIKFARSPYFDDVSEIFFSAGFEKRRMGTILVNLECTEEELFKSIDRDCRRCIRRGIEQGIEISEARNLEDLEQFYYLNVEHAKRSGIKIYPYSYFISLWNHFVPIGKLVIFISRRKDKPLAGLLCLMYNRTVHVYRLGDSDYARANKLYAYYPLTWHAIKWAQERGFKYFDWTGVELYKIDAGYQKALTIYRFKKKWGKLVEFHDYMKAFRSPNILKTLNHFFVDTL